MDVKNNMETFVKAHLNEVLQKFPGCCQCDECRRDMVVLALNHLPPRYVNSKMGDIYTRLDAYDSQEGALIIQEIAKAVKVVAQNPRHAKK